MLADSMVVGRAGFHHTPLSRLALLGRSSATNKAEILALRHEVACRARKVIVSGDG
ncbi:hypothetical protein SBI_10012 [Streptomyces bingchenggensis BCW-1]|uniref:Uncharacterized protein n=1 Tax=Streptomyces bingchenggensis (strain BCW-1) TaxID=749414 RepID=D7CFB4_STRBB|nr:MULTISPECIES: hypothetical protein [Streptomyces]ADI13130.1 hypothetical protein SBI_10012 [Streptomyces bingchenggensis BCW-1]